MFCEKCGNKIEDTMKFCDKCGAPVGDAPKEESVAQVEAAPQTESTPQAGSVSQAEPIPQAGPVPQAVPPQAMAGGKKPNVKMIGGIVAAVVLLLIGVVVIATRKPTINLNKYLKVSYSGYDTVGRAKAEFDVDAFRDDFEGKLKLTSKSKKELKQLEALFGNDWDPTALIGDMLYYSGDLSEDSQLTNGDKITFVWDVDAKEIESAVKCKIKYKDEEYTVEGLKKIETFDAFKDVEVTFSGTAPDGSASVTNNATDEAARSIYFAAEPSSGLKNGDTVIISIQNNYSDGLEAYFAETYGKIPDATEKTYTVEGLSAYMTSASEMPADMLEKMKKDTEDRFMASVARDWNEECTVEGIQYIGNYFLTSKDSYGHNQMYLVYKVNASIDNQEKGAFMKHSYYYLTQYKDIMILPDGTISLDLTRANIPGDRFGVEFPKIKIWGSPLTYRYTGYQDLDSMFNKNITTQIDQYNYENNVTDTAAEAVPEAKPETEESGEATQTTETAETTEENQ